ncbi:MAG: hypothetical protein ACTSXH_00795 [Promethearchaeota archaeon]
MDTSAIDPFIDKSKKEIHELNNKLSTIDDLAEKFKLLQTLAESYYKLSRHYELKYNLSKNFDDYIEILNAKQQSFVCVEKSLSLLRRNEVDVIHNARWFVNNLGFEYDYLVTYSGEIPRDLELYYSSYYPYPNRALNILLNNISDYQRLIGIWIARAENDKDYKNLFIYCEVMGDLFLLKQLLTEDLIDVNVIRYTDNAHFAYYFYDKAIRNRHIVDRRETALFGLVDPQGYNYQDVLYSISKKFGIRNIVRGSLEEKIKSLRKLYPHVIDKTTFPPFRSKTHERLISLIKERKVPYNDKHDKIFRRLCEWLSNMVNIAYDNPKYYRKDACHWTTEDKMHIWIERELNIFEAYTGCEYHREAESGGGKCEHWITNIPLEDKLISDYDDIEDIEEFLNKIYNEHGGQVLQYAEGKRSKYGLLLIADIRDKIKNQIIRRSPGYKCINLKYDKEYEIWIGIFIFQAMYKPPSDSSGRRLND